jgi:uncharacterized protein (TIGR00251 family)
VQVQPRAGESRIVGPYGGGIKVRIAAAPVDGAANEALIDLLAGTLHIPRRSIRIVHGTSSRLKLVEVDDDQAAVCRSRLEALLHAVDKAGPRR